MKKIFYIGCFIVLFILLGTDVNARECDYNELRELKALAKKVEVSYLFSGESKYEEGTGFTVIAHNLLDKYYFTSLYGTYMYDGDSSTVIGYFDSNTKVNINVYASNKTNCSGEKLRTIEIQLPYFNSYSSMSECDGNEKLDVCKKWYNTSKLTKEEFEKIINKNNIILEIGLWEQILFFAKQNLLITVSISVLFLIIIIALTIFIKRKNQKKRKLNI